MSRIIKTSFLAFSLFLSSFLVHPLVSQAYSPASFVYVNQSWSGLSGDPDSYGPALAMGYDAFSSIQEAINHSAEGAVIFVYSGTYSEQLTITHNLSLITQSRPSPSSGTLVSPSSFPARIECPTNLEDSFTTSVVNKALIYVAPNVDVEIRNFDINGRNCGNESYRFLGIAFNSSSGSVENVQIQNIANSTPSGQQSGIGIYAYNQDNVSRNIEISSSQISQYQKAGIILNGEALEVNVHDNRIIGSGDNNYLAQNGIQVGFGASGEIRNNQISNNYCRSANCRDGSATGTESAAGLLLYHPSSFSSIVVANNNFNSNQNSISAIAGSMIRIHNNQIIGRNRSYGIEIADSDANSSTFSLAAQASYLEIKGNNFTNQQNAIRALDLTDNRVYPKVNLSLNRFYNNSSAVISSENVIAASENNWWGCNEGPRQLPSTSGLTSASTLYSSSCASISPTFMPSSWIVLTASGLPDTMDINSSATVQLELFYNNLGMDTRHLSYIPSTPIQSITANLSPLLFASSTTSASSPLLLNNGTYNFTYTARVLGLETIRANVDGQSLRLYTCVNKVGRTGYCAGSTTTASSGAVSSTSSSSGSTSTLSNASSTSSSTSGSSATSTSTSTLSNASTTSSSPSTSGK